MTSISKSFECNVCYDTDINVYKCRVCSVECCGVCIPKLDKCCGCRGAKDFVDTNNQDFAINGTLKMPVLTLPERFFKPDELRLEYNPSTDIYEIPENVELRNFVLMGQETLYSHLESLESSGVNCNLEDIKSRRFKLSRDLSRGVVKGHLNPSISIIYAVLFTGRHYEEVETTFKGVTINELQFSTDEIHMQIMPDALGIQYKRQKLPSEYECPKCGKSYVRPVACATHVGKCK